MDFVPVQSFNNYVEAHIAMGSLQEQHINCWLKDEYTVTIDPILANAVGGIKLMVAKVQVPRAVEILRKAEKKQHYACPYCGSSNIHLVDTPLKKINLFTVLMDKLFGSNAMQSRQHWHCFTCGKDCKQTAEINTEAMEDVI